MNSFKKQKKWFIASMLAIQSFGALAAEFSASFKGIDIQEFIEIVGRNLEKTIIIDPAVRGKINVRSYDVLNEDQYYQFFISVLSVYGYALVQTDSGILKVVPSKNAKQGEIPVLSGKQKVKGDMVITRVISVKNVSVRELSPLLRQLIDNAGSGNVVHYDPANVLMITGRAAVVNRLADIIERIDQAGNTEVDVVELKHASAPEIVRIVEKLNKEAGSPNNTPALLKPSIVADERTNSVLISGEPKVRKRIKKLILQLDREMASTGNNRVVYLRYANAEDVVSVLQGVSENLVAEKQGGGRQSSGSKNDVKISAHKSTNSLVISAPPDIMNALETVISQLDIRRAQVLIEAMIVEMSESDGANLGIQWGSLTGGGIQFGNTGVPISNYLGAQEAAKDKTTIEERVDANGNKVPVSITETGDVTALAKVLGGVSGLAAGIVMGDWTSLVTAVSSNSDSNILSSPSLMVLDNEEATFTVGEEVPVVTGSNSGSNGGDNPFQTIERKDVGVKLKITPQINEGDSVLMKIEQEISNVLGANGAVDIRFGKRQLSTSILAGDGQMIVLSGLIDEQTNESEQKVPILGDIPLLGHLFKSTSSGKTKTNLMLFIKPTIIRTGLTADGITQRKYNYIRAEQIYRAQEGIKLLPGKKTPVVPAFGESEKTPKSLPIEVRLIMDKLK